MRNELLENLTSACRMIMINRPSARRIASYARREKEHEAFKKENPDGNR